MTFSDIIVGPLHLLCTLLSLSLITLSFRNCEPWDQIYTTRSLLNLCATVEQEHRASYSLQEPVLYSGGYSGVDRSV